MDILNIEFSKFFNKFQPSLSKGLKLTIDWYNKFYN